MATKEERDAERQAREELLELQRFEDDVQWLMDDFRGRRLMWRMLEKCHVFRSVFNTHGGLMNLNEGQRQVGLFLLGLVNTHASDQYVVMLRENAPKQQEEEESND